MTMQAYDTLAGMQRLRGAGLDARTAEAIVMELASSQQGLFAKTDGEQLEARLASKLDLSETRTSSKIDLTEARIGNKILLAVFGSAGVIVTAQVVLGFLGLK